MNSFKGSEWRRWDLHLHTPFTKLADGYSGKSEEEIWDRYIELLENSPVQAFGITDYFSCENYYVLIEKYKAKYPLSKKVFFPNIEFRFAEAISKANSNPNVHLIFDNDEAICSRKQINKFLTELKTLESDTSGVKVSCSDLSTKADYESASITMNEFKNALVNTFGKAKPYLIVFPANNDGIKSTDNKSPRKVKASDTMDELADLFFGNSKNKEWFLRTDRYEKGESFPKAVVGGSDAHSFKELIRLEGNVPKFDSTWIKSDLTFRGLQQICYEPMSRVFIGSEPLVEIRKSQQATKFLSSFSIDQVNGYDESNGKWFKNVDIPLNPELVAIIGNKGSGKSAFVDILGLLGESRQEPYFSFLSNDQKNKKFKQPGYAENFKAEMQLESKTKISKGLNERINPTKPELVRYLPQNYFEQLTNDIEIETFRREIEDVVFSHVDETDKMGKASFYDLQEFKTQQSVQEINGLKTRLKELNIEIIKLEDDSDPLHKKRLEEQLKSKQAELKSLSEKKPKKVAKPTGQTEEQKRLSADIAKLTGKLNQINSKGKTTIETIAKEKSKLQKLSDLQQRVLSLKTELSQKKISLAPICEELGLNIKKIISAKIDASSILDLSKLTKGKIQKLEKDNNPTFTKDTKLADLESLPDLRGFFANIQEQINERKEQLGTPQRKYQNYIDKLAKWESNKLEVIGEANDPNEGTINYLKNKLSYINIELSKKLEEAFGNRKEISKKIFESKGQILQFYSDLKSSVESRLKSVRTDDFSVNIEAAFVLDQYFLDKFLSFINKNKAGSFYGNQVARDLLKDILKDVNWNDFDSVYKFLDTSIKHLKNHNGKPNPIKEQVSDTQGFYDFLFSLDYFSTRYELKLAGKTLNELSPGEKGLLLLVFYLQLDKHNIPLIIDQPEDNLDNESIFTVLASCIREAKRNRQVILVTHNPNLAVGADAEQIIYVQLDKAKNYNFSYESGAIENPRINQKIIDVLEGTQPAFVKRRLKYQI